jgi:hypothetical protein
LVLLKTSIKLIDDEERTVAHRVDNKKYRAANYFINGNIKKNKVSNKIKKFPTLDSEAYYNLALNSS